MVVNVVVSILVVVVVVLVAGLVSILAWRVHARFSAVPKRGRSKCGRIQKHSNERKCKSAKELKRECKGGKRVLLRKKCKQTGLGTPKVPSCFVCSCLFSVSFISCSRYVYGNVVLLLAPEVPGVALFLYFTLIFFISGCLSLVAICLFSAHSDFPLNNFRIVGLLFLTTHKGYQNRRFFKMASSGDFQK